MALLLALARTVFTGTQAKVTGHLPSVLEPVPVADLAFDDLLAQTAQTFGQRAGTGRFDLLALCAHLFVQRDTGTLQRAQEFKQPVGKGQPGPVARAIPFAFQPVSILQGQTTTPLGDEFQIPLETLAQTALTALPFFRLGRHPHQGQRVGITGDETVQRIEHGQRIGAVGLDPFVLFIPIARAHDVIRHTQGGELPVQSIAERPGFIAGNDAPALGDMFLHPRQQSLGREALGRLGTAALILNRHDVL